MARLKGRIELLLLCFMVFFNTAKAGYLMNRTIYDTDPDHITYEPDGNFCTQWEKWMLWWKCANWIQPWKPEVYKSQERELIGVHRSLNHRLSSVTVRFEGPAIWLYGPPRGNLPTIPPDYRVCLSEALYPASTRECYRVNVAEAYSMANNYDEPVVIFAKGGLRYQKHQVEIAIDDPTDETKEHLGIQFSHAVYTVERPALWPVEEDHWRFRQVVMHDTHPLLSYNPKTPTSCLFWWWCSESGWAPKTYRAENGTIVSWHQLKSAAEWGRNTWGVETTITAGSVVIYGIPKAHIIDTSLLSQICVQVNSGPCRMVDVQHAYLNSEHQDEAVPLWRDDALDPSHKTRLSIRLVETDSGHTSVFPFKAIHYFEPQGYAHPDPLAGGLQNIEVSHDDKAITFNPKGHCTYYVLDWCANWVEPWVLRQEGPFGSRVTYRSTTSEFRTTDDPTVTFNFMGSAVYVYGAAKLFIKAPFASQRVCVDDVCHIVDVEQAYLNAPQDMKLESLKQRTAGIWQGPETNQPGSKSQNVTTSLGLHPEYEPVLIWGITGLDDQIFHKLQMALGSLPSEDNAEMSIAKIVYTRTAYRGRRPNTPSPQPDPRYEGPSSPQYAQKLPLQDSQPPPHIPAPPTPHLPSISSIILFLLNSTFIFLSVALSCRYIASKRREMEPLLPRTPPASAASPAVPQLPRYTYPEWHPRSPPNIADDTRTVISNTSTAPPPYSHVQSEAQVRRERTTEFVTGRMGRNSGDGTEIVSNNEGPRRHGAQGNGRRERRQRR